MRTMPLLERDGRLVGQSRHGVGRALAAGIAVWQLGRLDEGRERRRLVC